MVRETTLLLLDLLEPWALWGASGVAVRFLGLFWQQMTSLANIQNGCQGQVTAGSVKTKLLERLSAFLLMMLGCAPTH
jgi:hypothetical protein